MASEIAETKNFLKFIYGIGLLAGFVFVINYGIKSCKRFNMQIYAPDKYEIELKKDSLKNVYRLQIDSLKKDYQSKLSKLDSLESKVDN